MRFRLGTSNIREFKDNLQSFLGANWQLYSAIIVYIISFSTIVIFKNNVFLTSGFDLGIFNQAFSTTLFERRLFYNTADAAYNPNGSLFGTHFSPILFLLLPFYAIYPSIETLLVIQSIVLALGAIPIYWMAREKLNHNLAIYISILYLIYPSLNYINLNDFHLEAFLPTFFLFAVYYLEHEKWPQFLVFIILSMATIEFTQIIVVFVALYGLILYRRKKFVDSRKALRYLILTFLIGTLGFVLALKVKELFNPYASPIPSTFNVFISNPVNFLQLAFNDLNLKIFYVVCFLGPLAFVPLFSVAPLIMALPWISASFISNYPLYYYIYHQYNAFIIPFVFVALINSIRRLSFIGRGISLRRVKKILLLIYVSTILFGLYLPFAPSSPWNYKLSTTNQRNVLLSQVLALVPHNASILTQNDIFPHVSGRVDAFMYISPHMDISVDYILLDVGSIWYGWLPEIGGEMLPPKDIVMEGMEGGVYGVYASARSILLMKKSYVSHPVVFVPYTERYDYEALTLVGGSIIEDPTSSSGHVFHHDREDDKGIFWYGPYVNLLPGLYNVTYTIKLGSDVNPSEQLLKVDVTTQNGETLIAEKPIIGEQNISRDRWFNVTLTFELSNITENVEFRGFANGNFEIYLDYIFVEQLSPKPS